MRPALCCLGSPSKPPARRCWRRGRFKRIRTASIGSSICPLASFTVTFTLAGFTQSRARGRRVGRHCRGHHSAIELRIGALEETVTVIGASPVVDLQSAKREVVLRGDVIENLPGHARLRRDPERRCRASPSMPNGLANTPTMTFFTARGGNTNEGRMTINGMNVAASFNGGGVSSLTYDANNVEEVSVVVSGGMAESDVGGPVMNLVPKSGGNRFAGQMFWNTAGSWSRGDNLDDDLRKSADADYAWPRVSSARYDFNPWYGGPIKPDKLWFWAAFRNFETAQGVRRRVCEQVRRSTRRTGTMLKDTSSRRGRFRGATSSRARLTAQVTPGNRVMFSHEYQLRCEGSTLTTAGEDAGSAATIGSASAPRRSRPRRTPATSSCRITSLRPRGRRPSPVGCCWKPASADTRYWTNGGPGIVPPDGTMALIPVTESIGDRRPQRELHLSRREQLLQQLE